MKQSPCKKRAIQGVLSCKTRSLRANSTLCRAVEIYHPSRVRSQRRKAENQRNRINQQRRPKPNFRRQERLLRPRLRSDTRCFLEEGGIMPRSLVSLQG